jgi:polysaccharide export outer membrane protein
MTKLGIYLLTGVGILLFNCTLLSAQPAERPVFLLGPGDVLEVSVWKDPDLTKQVIVQPDGYLSFPLIGQVPAGGRTLADVESEIREKLGEFISSPTVTLLPLRIESYKVYVIGKVNNPGVFTIPQAVNVMQALSMAGGSNPFADLDKISILRQGPDGQERIPFDYGAVAKGKDLDQNIVLQSGDVVVVP